MLLGRSDLIAVNDEKEFRGSDPYPFISVDRKMIGYKGMHQRSRLCREMMIEIFALKRHGRARYCGLQGSLIQQTGRTSRGRENFAVQREDLGLAEVGDRQCTSVVHESAVLHTALFNVSIHG